MCVNPLTDNYGLYPPGPDLKPAIIYFLHIKRSNGEDQIIPLFSFSSHKEPPRGQSLDSNIGELSETSHFNLCNPEMKYA